LCSAPRACTSVSAQTLTALLRQRHRHGVETTYPEISTTANWELPTLEVRPKLNCIGVFAGMYILTGWAITQVESVPVLLIVGTGANVRMSQQPVCNDAAVMLCCPGKRTCIPTYSITRTEFEGELPISTVVPKLPSWTTKEKFF
jgi:hypothetical protein